MLRVLAIMAITISLIGSAIAFDAQVGLEMKPGEAVFEQLYYQGIGEPWVGGNPPWQQNQVDSSSAISGTSQSAVSQYAQYYTMPLEPVSGSHIKTPIKQEIKNTPATVYFGQQMQAVPYTQYQTYATYTGGNSLWIQGATSWTQYTVVPQGASLSLLSTTSSGGYGDLYEINPNRQLYKNTLYFFPGYNQIGFYADAVGQHILLFAKNGMVSNAIVIDVSSYSPSYQQLRPIPQVPPAPASASGDTPVSIVSDGMRGYQVFLDGSYIGTEGTGGDTLDGKFSFRVVGNQNHEIRVYDGQFNYPKNIFFQKGVQKIIHVEPGVAVYN